MKLTLTALVSLLPVFAAAQTFTSLDFEQAKSRAANEKKIILVDVSSKSRMNDEKFKSEKLLAADNGVAEFSTQNLIAVRMDMGSEAGKAFAPLLQMNMYPTYAFMMPDGDLLGVVHPSLVYKNPSLFLEKANQALNIAKEKWSNSRKIQFKEFSFDEAIKMAKSDGRLIFIDAYTDNCQPCIKMVKNVFSLDKVADFYNEKFICLSMNLGTEHTDLARKYNTVGYPTYLFINANGELILSESGYTEATKFISYGEKALNKSNIQFEHGTWDEIVAKAKREKKVIFLDCYTTWCGPCKQMANTVFTKPEVAEYFNSTFINAKFDMEKGEGIELKQKFGVNAYPTYVYIDVTGEVINTIVGSMPAGEFLERTKEGLSSNGLAGMQKRYIAGERGDEFLLDYLEVLETAYLKKESQKVAEELFKTTDLEKFHKNEYFKHFLSYMDDVDSDLFKYVYKNREQFYSIYPKDVIDRKLKSIWENGSRRYIKGLGDSSVIDKRGFKEYVKRMRVEGVESFREIEEKAYMYNALQSHNWKEVISLAETKINKVGLPNIPESELMAWGMQIDRLCKDSAVRRHAAGWFSKIIPIYEAKEARRKAEAEKQGVMLAMGMINYPKEFQKLYQSLSK